MARKGTVGATISFEGCFVPLEPPSSIHDRAHSCYDTAGADRPTLNLNTDSRRTHILSPWIKDICILMDCVECIWRFVCISPGARVRSGLPPSCREKLGLTHIYHPMLHVHAYSRLYLSRAAWELSLRVSLQWTYRGVYIGNNANIC